jgi:flagellum-specific peptidoglycan hydrolase FlgJ
MNILRQNLNIISKKLRINTKILATLMILGYTIMVTVTLSCVLFTGLLDTKELLILIEEDESKPTDTDELHTLPDLAVNIEEVKGSLVHAARFDEAPKGAKYDRFGLPLDRNWLTASEWQGKHLADPRDKSVFKTWKVIHMSTFIDYISVAAVAETKVSEYSKIPASLISSQAILESAFGVSRLAVDANNLFGHKCHDCTDPDDYVVAHDDSPTDRFKVKTNKWRSIRDHSKLLMSKYYPRIPNNRKANPDIKDWLNALCGCGRELSAEKSKEFREKGNFVYATSCYDLKEGYAKKIMNHINMYKLNKLDGGK